MAASIDVALDCPKKEIVVTWKVLLKGTASTKGLADALEKAFDKHFNNNGKQFKIGECTVIFKLDVKRALGKALAPGDATGERDIIVIEDPRPDGGGFAREESGKRQLILINPRPNGTFVEWKLINELGHGLGIKDTGKDLEGEWNLDKGDPSKDRVLPKHIEEALNARTPNAKKKAINDCCKSALAVEKPGKIKIEFPKKEFEESNPRDDLYKYFPPGTDNPFTPEYEAELKRWQALVEKYGLTEAYRRWRETHPPKLDEG